MTTSPQLHTAGSYKLLLGTKAGRVPHTSLPTNPLTLQPADPRPAHWLLWPVPNYASTSTTP